MWGLNEMIFVIENSINGQFMKRKRNVFPVNLMIIIREVESQNLRELFYSLEMEGTVIF